MGKANLGRLMQNCCLESFFGVCVGDFLFLIQTAYVCKCCLAILVWMHGCGSENLREKQVGGEPLSEQLFT